MDLKGSVVNTNIRIYPSPKLINFIASLALEDDIPDNILQFIEQKNNLNKKTMAVEKQVAIQLNNKDFDKLKEIVEFIGKIESTKSLDSGSSSSSNNSIGKEIVENDDLKKDNKKSKDVNVVEESKKFEENVSNKNEGSHCPYLLISDLDWLYLQLNKLRNQKHDKVPYIHELLQGSEIMMPENEVIKRNPELEARCVKLRAQQEAREYRKMTRGVDNVRMRFPEDSIAYQLKQMNRQLIAVVQFLLSIFAGFLFGFKGVEWMVGPLDFGFKLLLGVMCSLIIALAEIYFLAKKLNEELSVPETTQLGGPPKFVDESMNNHTSKTKEHQD